MVFAYTNSLKAEPMGPLPDSNRHDEPGAINQFVPVEAAMIDDVFIAGKDSVREPIVAHICNRLHPPTFQAAAFAGIMGSVRSARAAAMRLQA